MCSKRIWLLAPARFGNDYQMVFKCLFVCSFFELIFICYSCMIKCLILLMLLYGSINDVLFFLFV